MASKSLLMAFSLAARVMCGISERLQLDERLQLVLLDRRVVRNRGVDDGRQLDGGHVVEDLERHRFERDAKPRKYRELQYELHVTLERALETGRRDVDNLESVEERLQVPDAAVLLEAETARRERVEAETLQRAQRELFQRGRRVRRWASVGFGRRNVVIDDVVGRTRDAAADLETDREPLRLERRRELRGQRDLIAGMKVDVHVFDLRREVGAEFGAGNRQQVDDRHQGIRSKPDDRIRSDDFAQLVGIGRQLFRRVIEQRRTLLLHVRDQAVEAVFVK